MYLTFPESSFGLATLVNFLIKQSKNNSSFKIKTITLSRKVISKYLNNSYIKIDFEGKIIKSEHLIITRNKSIVGFEALSSEIAIKCMSKFKDYSFYFARFIIYGKLRSSY